MKRVKSLHITPLAIVYLAVFLTSLWIGHNAGDKTRIAIARHNESVPSQERIVVQKDVLKYIARTNNNSAKSPSTREDIPLTQLNEPEGSDRQRNILVIGVDSIELTQPRLKAVWMILYLKDLLHFMMMPIYPSTFTQDKDLSNADSNLAKQFNLDASNAPDPTFMQALSDKELWWSGYVVLDESALEDLLTFSYVGENSYPDTLDSIPDAWDDPFTALMAQTRFAQGLCSKSHRFSMTDTEELLDIAADIYPHYTTDLDLEFFLTEIKNALRYNGGISCEFPSLTVITKNP